MAHLPDCPKIAHVSDSLEDEMSTTAEQILSVAAARPEGTMLSAKELLHLGTRGSVDRALARLVERARLDAARS